ncbi:MAG: hypothetical protein Q9214_003499, partial [Letrouitia sp. 1 TL-2023]
MAYEPPSSHDYSDPRRHSTPYNQDYHHTHFEPTNPRPRETSMNSSEAAMLDKARSQPQPINEAVGSAFASDVPPELIAQITESVLKQLKVSGVDNSATPVPPPMQDKYPPPPPVQVQQPVQQPIPQSPSTVSGSSPSMPTRVFTPPSPHKHADCPSHESPRSQSQSGVLPGRAHSPQEPRSPIKETTT